MSNVQRILAADDELGEGPLWHSGEQALYWVDIDARRYHRLDPKTGAHSRVEAGVRIGALAVRERGGLVLASDQGFVFYDPTQHGLQPIGDPEAGKPETRFNDGAVDRAGRFWAGTLGDPFRNSLYCLTADLTVQQMDTGIDISNGIGWSPDDRLMYFVDSTPGLIYVYDFDLARGQINNRRTFVDRSAKPGVPDGLTVDADGFIWVAIWGGHCLERYDRDGQLVQTFPLPVRYPTSVAFGGPDLTDLYVTSAQCEIPLAERDPRAWDGDLLCLPGAGRGLPEPWFKG